MTKAESKYFNTAVKMDMALLELIHEKEFAYITVREICSRAHVNRSTFYLHYENTRDLLAECTQYVSRQFLTYYEDFDHQFVSRLSDMPLDALIFMTPEYLTPYLHYVKENKLVFQTTQKYPDVMGAEKRYQNLCTRVLFPILERFHFAPDERDYVASFYVHGTIAIIDAWLQKDCKESVETVTEIIQKCTVPHIRQMIPAAEQDRVWSLKD